jgi:ATP-dependent Clp protease ATP-binding subunit ClpC
VFERFTDRARTVLVFAQDEARLLNHSFIGTEHILLGIIREGDGAGARALMSFGISLEASREMVSAMVGMTGRDPGGSPPFTPRAKKVLELSLREALQLNHSYIGTEHLLLGLLREGEGVAMFVLTNLGADPARIREEVQRIISGAQHEPASVTTPDLSDTTLAESQVEPRCPRCRAAVAESARVRAIDVPADSSNENPLSVRIVFCRQCGTALQMFEDRP